MVLQVDGEERRRKLGFYGIEEGLLLHRLDGVKRAESQTKKAVGVDILAELCGHRCRSLNGLRSRGHTGDNDLVGVDFAGRTGAVAVGDLPGVAGLELGRIRLVVGVAAQLCACLEGGEYPAEIFVSSDTADVFVVRLTDQSFQCRSQVPQR